MPQLIDPNFSRAVVLMVEHNDQGSFGLVVNQPSEMDAATLLGALSIDWRGDPDTMVWSGGPVMPTSGWVLHGPCAAATDEDATIETGGTIELVEGVSLSTSPETLRAIAEEPPAQVRLLLGYSGWGPGQLAAEMARGSWLHADLTREIVFNTAPDEMWESALRSLRIDPESIVQTHGIH